MPPKGKDSKKNLKVGTPLKEIIPPTIKQPPREPRQQRPPEITPIQHKINEYASQTIPDDWPGDETAQNFDFGLENPNAKVFSDVNKFSLPPSMRPGSNGVIFWRRAKDLVISEDAEGFFSIAPGDVRFMRKRTIDLDTVEGKRKNTFNEDIDYSSPSSKGIHVDLFSIFEREETQEEAERRLKEATETTKTKKKPPKGKEEIIEGPVKIQDVKLSNLDLKHEMPAYCKWIASQLQIIKDRNIRDANTKKPIWMKVYPQKNGVPVYNPNGKYWVKLYFMGKEKKIEIDDKIPVLYNNSLFPRSIIRTEIWPQIITKALLKLNSQRWSDPKAKEIEVGDGSIMYALTGYIPETINISQLPSYSNKWKLLNDYLSDDSFANTDSFITCYCNPDYKPVAKSNEVKNIKELAYHEPRITITTSSNNSPVPTRKKSDADKHDNKTAGRSGVRSTTIIKPPTTLTDLGVGDDSDKEEEEPKENPFKVRPTYIIPGFGYSVLDIFENDNFNMVYVLRRTENDIKLRQEYINIQKVNLNKMTKEEKLEHRKLKKELKDKISEEDKKRMDMISKPAHRYKLLRVKSNAVKTLGRVPMMNIVCPFDNDDISLAKKCIMNKLSKPPNYDMYDLRIDDSKSVSTTTQQMNLPDTGKLLPLDDFSKLENAKEPLKRGTGGNWMEIQDFMGCFQYMQVYHNPNRYKFNLSQLIQSMDDTELTSYTDKEIMIIEGESQEEEKVNNGKPKTLVYSFQACRAQNAFITPKPFLILQKYDFQNFEVALNNKTLDEALEAESLLLENKNYVYRVNIMSPLTFHLGLYSDLPVKLMSLQDYLCKYEGYSSKVQQIDYGAVDKNKYTIYYKAIIQPLQEKEMVLCKFNGTDNVMMRFLRIKLVELTDKNFKNPENFAHGIFENPFETSYPLTEMVKIMLEPNKKYLLSIEGRAPFAFGEGTIDFQILCKKAELLIEPIDMIDPVEYFDKYVPTKYGIVFRERLFMNTEVQTSFFVKICNIQGVVAQTQTKGKKDNNPQTEEIDLNQKRAIKLELFRDSDLVSYAFGYNNAFLSNVTLFPTNEKDAPRNYYLQCTFDLREWPEAKDISEETQNLFWVLRIYGNDNIAVIRDTQKEDAQKAIKKSWEDSEPGRAERAKKSRKKFLAIEKKEKGDPLDADEVDLVSEPRVKRNREEEAKNNAKKGGAVQQKPKVPAKPNPNDKNKKDEVPEEKKVPERVFPKSANHVMDEVCAFLTHMQQPRLLEEGDDAEGVRAEENKSELRENVLMGKEEIYGIYERNNKDKEKIKAIAQAQKAVLLKQAQEEKEAMKQEVQRLIKVREDIKQRSQAKIDKEKHLLEVCKQEKPNFEDIDKLLSDLPEGASPELIKLAKLVRKDSFVSSKIEKLSNALAMYDIQAITASLDEIRNLNIELDQELVDKAEELIEESKKNPQFILDKQKEVQKAMKGKKK